MMEDFRSIIFSVLWECLHRALEQPKKNIPRYWNFIKTLPRLIKEERRKVKAEKNG